MSSSDTASVWVSLTVRQLLTTFPRRYEDLREVVPLGRLGEYESGTWRHDPGHGRPRSGWSKSFRRRVQRTIAVLRDESGEVEAIWFGRRFIERQLKEGDAVVASGKVRVRGWRPQLDNPDFQSDDGGDMLHAGASCPSTG